MSDHPLNLVLEHLRAIRADVVLIKDDLRELTLRVGRLEVSVADLRRDSAHGASTAWADRCRT